ncbi:MAG: SdrD B-like domain-containing protein, partial [Clostridiales bacterium]
MNNLSRFGFFVLLIATTLFYNNDIQAQNSCDLSGFTTYTQGGFGSPSKSGPGKVRDANFAAVFPNGLTIGSVYTLTLTNANAVMNFLPQGGTPGKFTANYNNATSTSAGVLAGQMVALTLNVKFNNAGVLGDNSLKLEDLVIAKGTLAGKTVKELMDLTNKALGGESVGYSFSDLNDAATSVNENFDNGTVNKGNLTCSLASGTLGDKVWFDSNKNGIQDAGEAGIQNITVQLYNSTSNALLGTTTTDANGLYLFNNLSAGSYYVKFVIPDGYKISPITQGTNQAIDSNPDQTGRTGIITLAKGEHNLTIDAGLYTLIKSDLSVVKSVSKNNPQCGEEIVYTIKITNNGPDNATNIQVNDLLPDGLIFSSYQADAGTYDKTSGTWKIDNLENGTSKTLTITVKVDCSVFNNNTMDLGPAKGYNLFVLGDITQPSSDTEGKVAVGGNASFANYSIGDKLPLNSGDVLIVDGTLTFTSGRVYNGNVAYGTSTNLPLSTVSIDGGELRQAHPIDFASAKTYFQHMSSTLANYIANGSTEFKWGKL